RMHDTTFNPAATQQHRIAPTLATKTQMLRGTVHDPIARQMGGVAGHAGLFSTAADLARFARMLMNGGELDGARILSATSIDLMRAPHSTEGKEKLRGLGWDLAPPFAAN